jgi:predicted small lipoprotein YifL
MACHASYLRSLSLLAAVALSAGALVGCGYKAPLYMPPPPDVLGTQPQPAQSTTPNIPPMQENPSLEPAPIVIE